MLSSESRGCGASTCHPTPPCSPGSFITVWCVYKRGVCMPGVGGRSVCGMCPCTCVHAWVCRYV